MKSKISALIDGELERHEAGSAFEALRGDAEARGTWRAYHLIGDTMRAAPLLSADFTERVAARLAAEPTVLAPLPVRQPLLEQRRWQLLSAAASVAAVAFVSYAFLSQEPAQVAPPVAAGAPRVENAAAAPQPQVAPPEAANDYLLAHQGYSPRNSLQGMAPYVRTVSSEARGGRR